MIYFENPNQLQDLAIVQTMCEMGVNLNHLDTSGNCIVKRILSGNPEFFSKSPEFIRLFVKHEYNPIKKNLTLPFFKAFKQDYKEQKQSDHLNFLKLFLNRKKILIE
jgi:hypothetical protein